MCRVRRALTSILTSTRLCVPQERAKLEARNKLNDANNPVQAGLESVAMNYDSKQHIIQELRRRLEQAQDQVGGAAGRCGADDPSLPAGRDGTG